MIVPSRRMRQALTISAASAGKVNAPPIPFEDPRLAKSDAEYVILSKAAHHCWN